MGPGFAEWVPEGLEDGILGGETTVSQDPRLARDAVRWAYEAMARQTDHGKPLSTNDSQKVATHIGYQCFDVKVDIRCIKRLNA